MHRERLGEAIARSVAHALRDVAQVVDVIELTEGRGAEGARAHALACARLREALLAQVTLLEVFSLTERRRVTPLSMADVVETAMLLARRAIGPSAITITSTVPRTLPPAIGVAGDMAEAFYAVLLNAVEALRAQGGGTVVVAGQVDDGALLLTVTDDGPGVPAMLGAGGKLFEWNSGGTQGIGLPVARDLVRRHGGELLLASRDGPGAEFLFRLPLWRRVAAVGSRRP